MATRMRSPNYPSISLQEAIERIKKIYEKTQKHATEQLVIAKLLGYSSMNGGSMTAISNLKKYGLLEDVGKELKVSADAICILFDPKESSEYINAIRKSALAPALFSDLYAQYGDQPPSDEVLKSFLIKKGFSHTAVDAPIRSYRDTMELVTSLPAEYTDDKDDKSGGSNMNQDNQQGSNSLGQQRHVPPPLVDQIPPTQKGMRQDVFSLDEGTVILQWPAQMSADSYEDFESWMQLQLKKIKRSIAS